VLGYKRIKNNKTIFVILNNDIANKSIEMKLDSKDYKGNIITNLIDGKKVNGKDNNYKIDLQPYQIMILK
jgi:hypothetical protein